MEAVLEVARTSIDRHHKRHSWMEVFAAFDPGAPNYVIDWMLDVLDSPSDWLLLEAVRSANIEAVRFVVERGAAWQEIYNAYLLAMNLGLPEMIAYLRRAERHLRAIFDIHFLIVSEGAAILRYST